MSAHNRQTTDAANAAGFGTNKLSEKQGPYMQPRNIEDGGASQKGKKLPDKKTGAK